MNILDWDPMGRIIVIGLFGGGVIIITWSAMWFAFNPFIKDQQRQIETLTGLLKEVLEKCKK